MSLYCLFGTFTQAQTDQPLVFNGETFQLTLSADGKIVSFAGIDQKELLDAKSDPCFAQIRLTKEAEPIPCSAILCDGETLTAEFRSNDPESAVRRAVFCVKENPRFITFELISLEGGDWYALEFARISTTIDYHTPDGVGATCVSMKLGSIALAMPGKSLLLGGKTYAATFSHGAKIAIIAAPKPELRAATQDACSAIVPGEMPLSAAGGPWAADTDKSYGNYIITGGAITADQTPKWIEHLKKFGIDQVDFHQGGAFRQGDFHFNETAYPNGTADFRQMSDRLRENGLITGLHTYAEFLSGNSRYVTPVPHPDLDTMAEWTLAADLDADAEEIEVAESTADVSTVTGFFVRNSLVLRIDDELIQFIEPKKEAPFGFTACQRGAFGTVRAEHKSGSAVRQMTFMFGLFAPKADSDLLLEIARETARAYNEGGFSMIYLDALDGTHAITADKELIWFYDTLFVNEIIKNCKMPPLMEYSTMNANIWLCRSRMGAWDSAHRGYRRFFDKHFASNRQSADAAFLPGQIGWLALCPSAGDELDGFQKQTLFPEDVHYLGAKSLAHNYGYSILDIPLEGISPAALSNGVLLARYNKIRRDKTLPAETLEKLLDPKLDVVLKSSETGDKIVAAHYDRFEPTDENGSFEFENTDAAQTPSIRIENRYSTGDADSPDAIELLRLDENAPVKNITSAQFDPPLDLSNNLAMGMWIYGDGQNERINIRVESPSHLVSGHTDHFVTVDFTGWRFVRFAEAQNGLGGDENWPIPCGGIYGEYREKVHYNAVSAVHLMVVGDCTHLKFRTLLALPLKSYHLINPTLKIGDLTFGFQGEIASGHYLEYDPNIDPASAVVRDPSGNVVSQAPVQKEFSPIPTAKSTAVFSAEKSAEVPLRAKITLRTLGEPLN